MIFLSKKKILVINGPNLNLLGKREPTIYGSSSLEDINEVMLQKAAVNNIDIEFLQIFIYESSNTDRYTNSNFRAFF